MGDTAEEKEVKRVRWLIARAETKRTIAVSKIRSVHKNAIRITDEPEVLEELQIAVTTLDDLWSQFETADENVLDGLIQIGAEKEYTSDMPAEMLAIINAIKAIALRATFSARSNHSWHTSYDRKSVDDMSYKLSLRLSEIPLLSFKSDFNCWPTFRDRFSSLVSDRIDIPKRDII